MEIVPYELLLEMSTVPRQMAVNHLSDKIFPSVGGCCYVSFIVIRSLKTLKQLVDMWQTVSEQL